MTSFRKVIHPNKEEFPKEFQKFYYKDPIKLSNYPRQINQTCILIPSPVIDSKMNKFCDIRKKKVDEIHFCNAMGFVFFHEFSIIIFNFFQIQNF
jgi:hypothetical protein